jgi:hypothetical protein
MEDVSDGVKVSDSDKHSSLPRYGYIYDRKNFIAQALDDASTVSRTYSVSLC